MGPDYDYPNPTRAVVRRQDWQTPLPRTLVGQDKFFGGAGQPPYQRDWPVPRGPTPGIVLRTFLNPVEIQLIGQDQLFGAPGQVPDYDWPNPRGPLSPIELRTWLDNLLSNTLSAPAAIPFYLLDWPNPGIPTFANALKTWVDSYTLGLIGQDNLPPRQSDWPNPVLPRTPLELRTWVENLLENTLFVPPAVGTILRRLLVHMGL